MTQNQAKIRERELFFFRLGIENQTMNTNVNKQHNKYNARTSRKHTKHVNAQKIINLKVWTLELIEQKRHKQQNTRYFDANTELLKFIIGLGFFCVVLAILFVVILRHSTEKIPRKEKKTITEESKTEIKQFLIHNACIWEYYNCCSAAITLATETQQGHITNISFCCLFVHTCSLQHT